MKILSTKRQNQIEEFFKLLYNMPKGGKITVNEMSIKEGETTPLKGTHQFDYLAWRMQVSLLKMKIESTD